MTFSTITSEDLKQAGIQWKHLIFAPAKVSELTSELTTKVEVEIMDLHSQIKKIYAHVNMSVCFSTMLVTFAFGCLIECLLVVWTRLPHGSWHNTAHIGWDYLN